MRSRMYVADVRRVFVKGTSPLQGMRVVRQSATSRPRQRQRGHPDSSARRRPLTGYSSMNLGFGVPKLCHSATSARETRSRRGTSAFKGRRPVDEAVAPSSGPGTAVTMRASVRYAQTPWLVEAGNTAPLRPVGVLVNVHRHVVPKLDHPTRVAPAHLVLGCRRHPTDATGFLRLDVAELAAANALESARRPRASLRTRQRTCRFRLIV